MIKMIQCLKARWLKDKVDLQEMAQLYQEVKVVYLQFMIMDRSREKEVFQDLMTKKTNVQFTLIICKN